MYVMIYACVCDYEDTIPFPVLNEENWQNSKKKRGTPCSETRKWPPAEDWYQVTDSRKVTVGGSPH